MNIYIPILINPQNQETNEAQMQQPADETGENVADLQSEIVTFLQTPYQNEDLPWELDIFNQEIPNQPFDWLE